MRDMSQSELLEHREKLQIMRNRRLRLEQEQKEVQRNVLSLNNSNSGILLTTEVNHSSGLYQTTEADGTRP